MTYVRNTRRIVFNDRCTDVIHIADLSPVNLCRLDGLRASGVPCGSLMLCSAGDDVTWPGRQPVSNGTMAVYRSRMSVARRGPADQYCTASSASTSKRMYHPAMLASTNVDLHHRYVQQGDYWLRIIIISTLLLMLRLLQFFGVHIDVQQILRYGGCSQTDVFRKQSA